MELLDEGKAVFRLRSRLCSSLYPVNAKIREFFAEYDRYILHTSHPLGNELLEVCFIGHWKFKFKPSGSFTSMIGGRNNYFYRS